MARVLVTGVSGFIAKHVALQLLQNGHEVVGTVRDTAKGDQVRETMAANGADTSGLSFIEADLNSDAGWADAVKGCDYVQHLASPFPLQQPEDREALVPEARDGMLRVVDPALKGDVKRVVVTSSMVSIAYRANRPKEYHVGPDDWTDPDWNALSAYIVSKTRAELALWDRARETGDENRVSVINPGLVLGPALDSKIGTSLSLIELMLKGAYPAMPPLAFVAVDVRDLAALHIAAMTEAPAAGQRLIGSAGSVSISELAGMLRDAFPEYEKKIPKGTLPAFLVRLLANFDRNLKGILPDLGVRPIANADYVTEKTGIAFRPIEEAVIGSAQSLIDFGIIETPDQAG